MRMFLVALYAVLLPGLLLVYVVGLDVQGWAALGAVTYGATSCLFFVAAAYRLAVFGQTSDPYELLAVVGLLAMAVRMGVLGVAVADRPVMWLEMEFAVAQRVARYFALVSVLMLTPYAARFLWLRFREWRKIDEMAHGVVERE